MKNKDLPERIILKEEAIFWLDAHGFWHTAQGKFENKKIIAHFHSSIRRDEKGYYLEQEHAHYREKVYFRHEDTALFVFHVQKGDPIVLVLNTGRQEDIKPKKLYIIGESLYIRLGNERVKFSENALLSMADYLEDDDEGRYFIRVKGRRYRIPEEK
jgi:hypothetical protein